MKTYEIIIRRLILLIPVLFGASLITFSLSHVFQNPVYAYIPQSRWEKLSQLERDRIIKEYHLDEPWYAQYVYYVQNLLQGDWGYSESANQPVLEAIATRFPATIELTILATIFAVSVGIPLGVISAVKKDSLLDHVARLFALSGVSVPVFWLAMLMQYQLAFKWGLFPTSLRVDTFVARDYPLTEITGLFLVDSLLTLNFTFFQSAVRSIIMPAFALGWLQMALISRMTRTSMLEAMKQDYIVLARSKGLSERIVVYKHALRNAMIPTITVVGLSFAGLLTGAVLTETVFGWPGMGRLAVQGIVNSDSATIQGFVLLTGMLYVTLNLIVDILYTVIDPRITLE